MGETEGLALLGAGDATGAHDAYSAALVERPNSGFALYGLARSSEAAGHIDTARAEYTKFLEAWRDSDPLHPRARPRPAVPHRPIRRCLSPLAVG